MARLRGLIWNLPYLSEAKKLELFPPFWLMRIRVVRLDNQWREVVIRLPRTWISKNPGGSLFGGFQAALADVVAPLACAQVFPGYSIWTRSLKLDFHSSGLSDLELRFSFSSEQEGVIRSELENRGRSTPVFEYAFYNAEGKACTTISNTVAIRPKGYQKKSGGLAGNGADPRRTGE